MSGITDLQALLAAMDPVLREGAFAFVTLPDGRYGDGADLGPVAACAEPEGLTLVVPRARAEAAGLAYDGAYRMITLRVHSSLAAVGLTAAVAEALTQRGISANIVAAYYHDHVLVPADRADEALSALRALSASARS